MSLLLLSGWISAGAVDLNKENRDPKYVESIVNRSQKIVVLKDVPWEKFLISLFHDENGNWELDMNEQGIPVEGYAREKCKKEADASATVKMKMYYPVND